MLGRGNAAFAAILLLALASTGVSAQVMDPTYRGRLVSDKPPFTRDRMRDAIEVAISSGDVRYTHVVRLRDVAEPEPERGTGSLNGLRLDLQGAWKDGARQYNARYSGV